MRSSVIATKKKSVRRSVLVQIGSEGYSISSLYALFNRANYTSKLPGGLHLRYSEPIRDAASLPNRGLLYSGCRVSSNLCPDGSMVNTGNPTENGHYEFHQYI